MDAKKTGRLIAEGRREAGLTQAELAAKLHVTDKAVSRWERGVGLPEIGTVEPLARVLGISVTELMHGERRDAPTVPDPEAAELMQAAALIVRANRLSERTATALALAAAVMIGAIIFLAGKANIGGAVFTGSMAAVVNVSVYYFMESREDKTGRIIAAVSGLAGAAILGGLLVFMFR